MGEKMAKQKQRSAGGNKEVGVEFGDKAKHRPQSSTLCSSKKCQMDACYTTKRKINFCTLLLVSISAG